MTRKEKYRIFLKMILTAAILFSVFYIRYYVSVMVPDKLRVSVDGENSWIIELPFFDGTVTSESEEVVLSSESNIPSGMVRVQTNDTVQIQAQSCGTYRLNCKLFGWLPIRTIEVESVETSYVVPCGTTIGIYLKTDVILVIGTSEIKDAQGKTCNPAEGIVESGDYIVAANGEALNSKEELAAAIQESHGEDMILQVRRNKEVFPVKLRGVCSAAGEYRLGIWVRDDTQGIGTLTYMEKDGSFGALGHGISDSDTGKIVEISDGGLYRTSVKGITKGSSGKAGSLSGMICYGDDFYLGQIEENGSCGIFGKLEDSYRETIGQKTIPIVYSQEVYTGTAWIRSSVSGKSEDYEIRITKINRFGSENKQLVIEVTDERLLELTGGIVQGMSGSPIIQDGKLVGAVTHVLVNDPTRGYGIFIENMLDAAE